ncbi:MAG TPA: hypothetical protein VHX36_15930 [Candidatus Acidoferrales bacterium]|jgi:hypothetical protein|nr:hypothetical protein [Candidatus Acidoferrales bacterium]
MRFRTMMLGSIRSQPVGSMLLAACLSAAACLAAGLTAPARLDAQAPSTPLTTWSVSVVLPPRIVAGRPATLAALGVDGRLASGVKLAIGDQQVTTDSTGRALFSAPASAGYVLAKASGGSFAALVDAPPGDPSSSLSVAPVISLHDQFSICGTSLSPDADGNLVKINGQMSLVLAASPECIVVLPSPKLEPGPATISIATDTAQFTAKTSMVALAFQAPNPAILPGKKGDLVVRAQGSEEKLRLVVDNETPGVLRFLRGERQEVVTSGGQDNTAAIKVQAVASGAFSFHARIIGTPDPHVALRYLQAAELLAPKNSQRDLLKLIDRLDRHPRDSEQVVLGLDQIRSATIAGDLRTLLDAARAEL